MNTKDKLFVSIVAFFGGFIVAFGLFLSIKKLIDFNNSTPPHINNPIVTKLIKTNQNRYKTTLKQQVSSLLQIPHQKPSIISLDIKLQDPPINNIYTKQTQQTIGLPGNLLDNINIAKDINSTITVDVVPIFKMPPKYPNRAKILKKEGYVTLEFIITKMEKQKILK